MNPLSSVLCLLTSVFCLLTLPAFAQDDIFITVSAPAPVKGDVIRAKEVPQPVVTQVAAPATPTILSKLPVKPKEEVFSREEQELLRDPFWSVGFYPEGWQKKKNSQGSAELDASGWNAAIGKMKISGTSQLGTRTMAIVNGELKSVGDLIEVLVEGKPYQWQIIKIESDGQVQLKKMESK